MTAGDVSMLLPDDAFWLMDDERLYNPSEPTVLVL